MFDNLPISKFRLIPGRTTGAASQELSLSGLTIFVGPNNSGKSLILREITRELTNPQDRTPAQIVTEFALTPLDAAEANFVRSKFERDPPPNLGKQQQMLYYAYRGGMQNLSESHFLHSMSNPLAQPVAFRQFYLNNFTLTLSGENRISLTNPQGIGNLDAPDPFQSLQVLFSDDSLRAKVRAILHRAFSRFFILDPTSGGHLTIKFAHRAPANFQEEQGLHKQAREYYKAASSIADASDGVKAYTGIITQVVAGEPRVIIIDEPEAFLHPPLAQQLGKEIADLARDTAKNVFVSTHSANFLMGSLQAGSMIDVVRLTYRDGNATARILQREDLAILTGHPLLRSTGVLNALFYESVIVTESDSDRAFYQEVNDRLLKFAPERGIPNCLFLNAQNKQTTRIIIKPLRALGIPAISIVDIDVLKEGGSIWSDFLESGYVPELDRMSFATARDVCNRAIKETGKNMKKDGGVALLDEGRRESLNNLFDRLEDYGLFIVRGGEVESWLKHLGAKDHGSNWLVDIFGKMGSDPKTEDYVFPDQGDVWDFMGRAKGWLLNSKRRGIPS